MSKIFIKITLVFIPFIVFSQEKVIIQHLPNTINTIGAEFNFLQTDEDIAFYTSSTLEEENYQSLIFKTELKDGEWQKGKYVDFGKSFSIANISYQKNESFFYLSVCDKFNNCKIAKKSRKDSELKILKNKINLLNSKNTHPHKTTYNDKNILYFVSDRKGGFGELDIWFCIIDKFGNYGEPINAGIKINSKFNDITPFYNIWTGELFFSSDRKKELTGFDIYKSSGSLNFWEESNQVKDLSSEADDLYLTFYDEYNGYFASNRAPALFEDEKNCCNDIFSFQYPKKDTIIITFNDTIKKHLPIKLYFHNDEPDNNTLNITTQQTYKDAYISYYLRKNEYLQINPTEEMNLFFEKTLKGNYNKLSFTLQYLLESLNKGSKMEIHIKGFASPLHEEKYNINLSQRRISSLMNMIRNFESGQLNSYLENGNLKIIQLPFGENKSQKYVNDNPKERKKSVYSIDAMLERKIEIIEIIKL